MKAAPLLALVFIVVVIAIGLLVGLLFGDYDEADQGIDKAGRDS